ncbi:MAG: type II secretion system protein [Alphaproteobacteria bacterium]|nr:type II secretion system protein [Alphaproteobacteria bacterium]
MRNFEIKNNDCHAALAMTKSVQSGRSMIEMLGVLAIIGVLSVGGIAGYSKAMMKYRINKTIEQISLIAGNVRAFWGPQKNYIGVTCWSNAINGTCDSSGCKGASGVDARGKPTIAYNGCPIVKKAKIFPDEMITVTDGKIMSITNPFGSGVWLVPTSKSYVDEDNKEDNKAFFIELHNIPEEACIELATYNWSNIASNTILWISPDDGTDYYAKAPLNVDEAIKACTEPEASRISFSVNIDVDPASTYWSEKLSDCAIANSSCEH